MSARARVGPLARLRLAVLVGLGYYLAVQVGLQLRFPPATTSVLWPPNSLLTAALLVTPPRLWWVCLAGAFPAHLLMQVSLGWPLPMVAGLFVTNCSEALIAAGGIRAFSDAPQRFDTLRTATVFIVAAGLAAPVLSSFADAAIVHALRGEDYWAVWRTRVFANSLTELSVVPVVVLLLTAAPLSTLRSVSRRRFIEAAALGAVLVVVGLFAMEADSALGLTIGQKAREIPGVPPTTVFLLPLFFWAALRFGAGGMSATLLMSALIASLAARFGRRPFNEMAAPDSLVALQMILIVMAIPLYAVAALLEERRRAMADLADRLRFEALLSRVSGAFVTAPGDQLTGTIESCLRRGGEFFHVDRAAILQMFPADNHVSITQQWSAPGITPLADSYACNRFPWLVERVRGHQDVVCESLDDPPFDDGAACEELTGLGLRAAVIMPLLVSGNLQGAISLQMVRASRQWTVQTISQMHVLAEIVASALARKQSEDALRSSESMNSAILTSLSSAVAVLDDSGVIITVNKAWIDLLRQGTPASVAVPVGVRYRDACCRYPSLGATVTPAALAGIDEVVGGRRAEFALEYPCGDGDERWYVMSVVRLQRSQGGAVVSHVDVTERRRAEIENQRARHELSHFVRVATMGELTASLAHQLNQPLTGILGNAQAARRLLDVVPPDLDELRQIVVDIIEDDRRAGGVIRRLRDMMTKSQSEPKALDVNAVIQDVATLIASDSVIRNVPMIFELAPEPLVVLCDLVDFQQVILNLLVNAMDAASDRPITDRRVVVRTERTSACAVLVAVTDTGRGLLPGTEEHVFEPFFTTKEGGMGMGLSIARSIVELQGGHIWAESADTSGTTFYVSLPTA